MLFKPTCLSDTALGAEELKKDKKACLKTGPCGLGEKAIYLNSFYIDRCYYVPIERVNRVYKRVALSKGGFSGKGMFASIPYLVVEYDNGKEKQCTFKDEGHVDALLAALKKSHPEIPQVSVAAQKRLDERAEALVNRDQFEFTDEEQKLVDVLHAAEEYLELDETLYTQLSFSAKRKRSYQTTSPSYRWTAMFITIFGMISLAYGVYSLISHGDFGIYFTLFGFAAVFLFAGYSVLPTARNNKTVIYKHYDDSLAKMTEFLARKASFPVPARYAHPVVLQRMVRVIGEHRAASIEEALEVVKADLKALTPDVQVEQEEYDEVVAVKPLFTVQDYK